MADYWGNLYPLSMRNVRHYNSLVEARKDLMDWMMRSNVNRCYIRAEIWEQKTKPKSFDNAKYELAFTGYVKDRDYIIQYWKGRYAHHPASQYVDRYGRLKGKKSEAY